MKVLLLGGSGQLGQDILAAHSRSGATFQLATLDRQALDLSASDKIEASLAAQSFDVLINCTGYHKTDEAETHAGLAFAVNGHSVAALARACAAQNARLMHVSTDYVFGGNPGHRNPFTESCPTAPVNVYGASKAFGETLAGLAHDDVVILRVASLFGIAGARAKQGNFVETMLRLGQERRTLQVVADQTMSPTATACVARTILKMVADNCPPGIWHLVNTGNTTWHHFAQEVFRLAGLRSEIIPCTSHDYPTRARRPLYSALDNGKVSTAFGSMPTWQEALATYIKARDR